MAQAHIPPLSGVSQSCAVDMLHQLRQSLGEEGQVDFVPDVVLGPLEQVQQGLQEGAQLWVVERKQQVRNPRSTTLQQYRIYLVFVQNPSSWALE